MKLTAKPLFPIILTVILTIFILVFIGIAIWSAFLDYDLVSPDYYKQGVEYQQQIDRMKRVSDQHLKVLWNLTQQGTLVFKFPVIHDSSGIEGRLMFFRPSDAAQDRIIKISPDDKGIQEINIRHLSKGYWRIKIYWSLNGQELYQEDDLFIK